MSALGDVRHWNADVQAAQRNTKYGYTLSRSVGMVLKYHGYLI